MSSLIDSLSKGRYLIQGIVHNGYNSEVVSAIDLLYSRNVILKVFQIKTLEQSENYQNELDSHLLVNGHPNIVLLHQNYKFQFDNTLFGVLALEMMEMSLNQYITQHGQQNIEIIQFIAKELTNAVQYMHSKGVYHTDLHLDNILVKINQQSLKIMQLKICDFSFATSENTCLRHKSSLLEKRKCEFLPPEVNNQNSSHSVYMEKIDVWCIGVVIYYLITNLFPFSIRNNVIIQNSSYLIKNEKCRKLVEKIFHENPLIRPSVNEIVNHPFFCDNFIP